MPSMRGLLKRKKSNPKMDNHNHHCPASRSGTSLLARNAQGDRVFPIRNLQNNADAYNSTASMGQNGTSQLSQPMSHSDDFDLRRVATSVRSSGSRTPLPSTHSDSGRRSDGGTPRVTGRSQMISSRSGGPPGVVQALGPDMEEFKNVPGYRRCEEEPIRTPGAIQSFGALIGLRYNDLGDLEVRIASENSRKILGYGPEQLFALTSFLDVLKDDVRHEMIARVNNCLNDPTSTDQETRLDIFQITLTFPFEPEIRLWCAIHFAPNVESFVLCEFEEYADAFYLKDIRAS